MNKNDCRSCAVVVVVSQLFAVFCCCRSLCSCLCITKTVKLCRNVLIIFALNNTKVDSSIEATKKIQTRKMSAHRLTHTLVSNKTNAETSNNEKMKEKMIAEDQSEQSNCLFESKRTHIYRTTNESNDGNSQSVVRTSFFPSLLLYLWLCFMSSFALTSHFISLFFC